MRIDQMLVRIAELRALRDKGVLRPHEFKCLAEAYEFEIELAKPAPTHPLGRGTAAKLKELL